MESHWYDKRSSEASAENLRAFPSVEAARATPSMEERPSSRRYVRAAIARNAHDARLPGRQSGAGGNARAMSARPPTASGRGKSGNDRTCRSSTAGQALSTRCHADKNDSMMMDVVPGRESDDFEHRVLVLPTVPQPNRAPGDVTSMVVTL